jgi:NADH-quinone oxidoreductase subunit I
MGVTMRHFFQPTVTMHYPDEKWRMADGFRGLIKCDREACIVCDLCAKACPVQCIDIGWKREAGKAGKLLTHFIVDYQKCLFCGLCTYPCPTIAIFHSHEYEVASYTRDMQVIDWNSDRFAVKNPNAKPMAKDKPKPAVKPTAAAPSKPAAEHAPAPAATATAGQAGVASGIGGTSAKIGDRGKVKKVWIIEGCIVCDLCEDTAPDVFNVTETTCTIKMESQDRWGDLSDPIVDAAVGCPVNVILYELE